MKNIAWFFTMNKVPAVPDGFSIPPLAGNIRHGMGHDTGEEHGR